MWKWSKHFPRCVYERLAKVTTNQCIAHIKCKRIQNVCINDGVGNSLDQIHLSIDSEQCLFWIVCALGQNKEYYPEFDFLPVFVEICDQLIQTTKLYFSVEQSAFCSFPFYFSAVPRAQVLPKVKRTLEGCYYQFACLHWFSNLQIDPKLLPFEWK